MRSKQIGNRPMGNRRDRTTRRGSDPSAGIRALRLERLFREELNSILDGELGTLVELSRDGSRARIWYAMTTALDTARLRATEAAFARAANYFRTRLSDALPLKRSPELSFRHDPAALSSIEPEEMSL